MRPVPKMGAPSKNWRCASRGPGDPTTEPMGCFNRDSGLATEPIGCVNRDSGLATEPVGCVNRDSGLATEPMGCVNRDSGNRGLVDIAVTCGLAGDW